jgi:ribosomal protein S18 acetylase RimI-like enzyme
LTTTPSGTAPTGATPPGTVSIVPATGLSLAEVAELYNLGYQGYAIPFHVDAAWAAFMFDVFDLLPEHSCLALRDGERAGIAMLGVRGRRGWVGGVGVVPEARRQGIGEQLMRALLANARAIGLEAVQLEVMEPNTIAKALYDKLGFVTLRRVEVLEMPAAAAPTGLLAHAVSPHEAHARIIAHRTAREPWQRDDDTIMRLDVSTPALRGLSTPGGDAIYRVTDGRASILQMVATSETSAGVLIDTIRSRSGVTQVRFLNVPERDLAAAAMRARGATLLVAQFEMELKLG